MFLIAFIVGFVGSFTLGLIDPNITDEELQGVSLLILWIAQFPVFGWMLAQKNRRLWNLLWLITPVGWLILLCLENRSEQKGLEATIKKEKHEIGATESTEEEYRHSVWEIYRKEWETANREKRLELNKRMSRWQELMKSGLSASQAYIKVMEEEGETPRLAPVEKKTEDIQELQDNPSWLLKQALRAFDKKHYRYSSWLCWLRIRRNPNDYFALCQYAQSLYHSGKANDRKAASLYKRAIGVKPEHPLAHAGLGLIHHDNALKIYREYSMFPGGDWLMFADEKSPEDEGKFSLITSYADSQVGNRKVAVKELEEAANLTSDKDEKVQWLDMAAEIHCIIGSEDGITAYKKILSISPDYVRAHYYLAGCYAATGKRELALQEYKFITEHAPEVTTDLESELARFNLKINR